MIRVDSSGAVYAAELLRREEQAGSDPRDIALFVCTANVPHFGASCGHLRSWGALMSWSALVAAAVGGGALGSLLARTTEAQKALRTEMVNRANDTAVSLRAAITALEAVAAQSAQVGPIQRLAVDEAERQITAAARGVAAMQALFASEIYFLGECAVDDLAHALRLARELPDGDDEPRKAILKLVAAARMNAAALMEAAGADIRRPLGLSRSIFRSPRFADHIGTAMAVESRRAARTPGCIPQPKDGGTPD